MPRRAASGHCTPAVPGVAKDFRDAGPSRAATKSAWTATPPGFQNEILKNRLGEPGLALP